MEQLTCKTCGASLSLDLTKPKLKCAYCKTEYLMRELLTEQRIHNMDAAQALTPTAENAYKLYKYLDAERLYAQLIYYDPSPVNIARYNICLLGNEEIQPTSEFFETVAVLEPKELYKHITKISETAGQIAKQRNKYVLKTYQGVQRLKEWYKIHRWQKPYKQMEEYVKVIPCACGKQMKKGVQGCSCGKTRFEVIKRRRSRRNKIIAVALILAVGVIVAAVCGLLKFIGV